ncbi:hypothetical protein SCP_1402110 [Sparassis crispa]|uniref:Uncharacterized protein n=1 Tax=Sparassis crispa TaxID=139825 RepID=A0A401H2Y9_9APHY|nr:hypothetical protein SCP_1402110 [Sparassis crispa]GBE88806.1 hypothetical protein SCP_1402110 [Sparassis crispa]
MRFVVSSTTPTNVYALEKCGDNTLGTILRLEATLIMLDLTSYSLDVAFSCAYTGGKREGGISMGPTAVSAPAGFESFLS